MMLPDLITPKELAQKLRVSQAVVYVWVQRGVIPHIDLAQEGAKRGAIRFVESEIAEWIKQRHKNGN